MIEVGRLNCSIPWAMGGANTENVSRLNCATTYRTLSIYNLIESSSNSSDITQMQYQPLSTLEE